MIESLMASRAAVKEQVIHVMCITYKRLDYSSSSALVAAATIHWFNVVLRTTSGDAEDVLCSAEMT